MNKELHVLIVEDSEDDALLLMRKLRHGGYEPVFKRVETREAMNTALDKYEWDIVITDYNMPQFNGAEALKLLKGKEIDIPFIIVSGNIGEETAVEMMKAGAHDYITKDNLLRFVSSVEHALSEAWIRRKRRDENARLKMSERSYRSIFNSVNDAIFIHDINNGDILDVNQKMTEIFGYTREEALCLRVEDISSGVPPYTRREVLQWIRKASSGEPQVFEWRAKSRAGRLFWVEVNLKLTTLAGKKRIIAVVRDITDRKRMEDELTTMSITDELTGLCNRRGFLNLADQHLKLASRMREKVLLLFADLDGLKNINDKLGHRHGDLALVETANILKNSFRKSDIIARVGGDEFVVLQTGNSNAISDLITARVQQNLETYNTKKGQNPKLSISVGIVHYDPEESASINELLIQADKMMYVNKKAKQKFLFRLLS